jgi:hypothetical protein
MRFDQGDQRYKGFRRLNLREKHLPVALLFGCGESGF